MCERVPDMAGGSRSGRAPTMLPPWFPARPHLPLGLCFWLSLHFVPRAMLRVVRGLSLNGPPSAMASPYTLDGVDSSESQVSSSLEGC
ncbi:hypothetical protein BDW68DRAFT_161520 [Aspergillus falconensis]